MPKIYPNPQNQIYLILEIGDLIIIFIKKTQQIKMQFKLEKSKLQSIRDLFIVVF